MSGIRYALDAGYRASAESSVSVSALAVPVPALPASRGLFLAEAAGRSNSVEIVRAYRILEVVGGLILGLVCRLIRIVRVTAG